jgi:chorismate mutase
LPVTLAALLLPAVMLSALVNNAAVAQTPSDSTLAESRMLNIVSLASTRLSQARAVAQWKWQAKQPINDPERESLLLDSLLKVAPHYGMDLDYASTFFHDQFTANKQVQQALFAQWGKGPAPAAPAEGAIQYARQSIDQTSTAMLSALALVQPLRARDDCPILLSRAITKWTTQLTALDTEEKAALPTALQHVCTSGGIGGTA